MFLKFLKKKKAPVKQNIIDGIDLLMQYCPDCEVEYREGVKLCVHCDTQLISGKELLQKRRQLSSERSERSMLIEEGDEMVSLTSGPLQDMKSLQHKLKKAWIPSMLVGEEAGCRSCGPPQVTVQIKRQDGQEAQKVLEKDFIESTGLDLNDLTNAEAVFDIQAKEVSCPACGCRFSPTVGACPDCGLSFA